MARDPRAAAVLPAGIIAVIQTPFTTDDTIDVDSLEALIEHAIRGGVDGFLAPAVASETDWLSTPERVYLIRRIAQLCQGRVPYVVGASDRDPVVAHQNAQLAESVGAAAYLVAVPPHLYEDPAAVVPYLQHVAHAVPLPMIVQDFQLRGPGLPPQVITQARHTVGTLAGVKIETTPAGPKYTAVRRACGEDFFICGGWAVQQMIEALDRGIDAMIPESSMVRVYKAIHTRYQRGDRDGAKVLFHHLLPVLAFTNQDVATSIAFFKRLLVRRGIFTCARTRATALTWDRHSDRIAEELIDYYLGLEREAAEQER